MFNCTTLKPKSKIKKADFSPLSITLSVAIFLVFILILLNPTRYAISVVSGLKLYFFSVLPGLLPFMFLTKTLTNLNVITKLEKPMEKPMNKVFHLSKSCFYPFFMSMISGYPIGSTITADLYQKGKISDSEVTLAALLSSTSGPIFVIGAVGSGMLKSPLYGLIIYLCNIAAVVITTIILGLFKKNIPLANEMPAEFKKSSLNAVAKDTCTSLLVVGFYISFFSLVIDMLTDLNILTFLSTLTDKVLSLFSIKSSFSLGVMSGIIEMTNGAKILSANINVTSLSLIGFVIGFSGFSIIMQSLSFMSSTKIKVGKFVLGKFFQAIITFLLCLLVFSIIKV